MTARARRSVAALLAATVAFSATACISDRSSGPGPNLEGCNVSLPAEAFGSSIVVMRDFNFLPAQSSIRPGGKVTWVNCDPAGTESHTSTANGGQWDSQLMQSGATFTREYATAGLFPYHCTIHPGMTGTVTVQ